MNCRLLLLPRSACKCIIITVMICDKYHIDGNGDGSDNDRDNGLVLLSSGDIYMTTSRWSSCK